jgi:hypothetical protein
MKSSRLSVVLAGVLSLTAGCQPDEAGFPLESATAVQQSALTEPVGSWTRLASNPVLLRGQQTVTVLGSGEVLFVYGGITNVYNPYADTWRGWRSNPLGNRMGYAEGHSATLLASGKVLLAGGRNSVDTEYYDPWDYRAYLYDPATDTYTRTGNMKDRRGHHVSVLLDSGKVLVLGGYHYYVSPYITSSSEMYDPETGTWSHVPDDLRFRKGQTATQLYSGEVMVTGGTFEYVPETPTVVTFYNPATNTWRFGPSLPHGRSEHLAQRLYSGHVMVLGGTNAADTSVDVYDPYSGQWTAGPALPIPGPYTTATLLYSGEVLVTTGQGKAVLYSPDSNTWLPVADQQGGAWRYGDDAVRLHTGQVLLSGGTRAGTPEGEYTPAISDLQRFTR